MYQVRKNVFETNSSSTHSIAISKVPVDLEKLKGKHIIFEPGEWGWESCCECCTEDYLYTAIVENSSKAMYDERIELLTSILDKYGVTCEFDPVEEVPESWGTYLKFTKPDHEWCSIDHPGDLNEMIEALLHDEDLLLRYLFGDSCIYTGNDNGCEPDNMCFCADAKVWDHDCNQIDNPNHQPDKYDYFSKGN